jgi:TRAP transporter TAXI family solute receptor
MALTQATVAYYAQFGEGPFADQGPLINLRAVANLFPEAVQLVARRDSDIESVRDLEGKRVSLGELESGTLVITDIVLGGYGLGRTDLTPAFERVGTAGDMLVAGELDAFFAVNGYPITAIVQTAESTPIRLVQIRGPEADKIRKTYPFLGADVIPAGTYAGVGGAVTLKVGALLVVSSTASDELIYAITRALWHPNNRKLLDTGHPLGKRIELHKALDGIAIPLHPGADRFYREAGMTPRGG